MYRATDTFYKVPDRFWAGTKLTERRMNSPDITLLFAGIELLSVCDLATQIAATVR
jgi:hypothetical protein